MIDLMKMVYLSLPPNFYAKCVRPLKTLAYVKKDISVTIWGASSKRLREQVSRDTL